MERILPLIPLYLDKADLHKLSVWLNSEENIAVIQSIGEGRWKAFSEINLEATGKYCLFHTGAGPLPMLIDDDGVTARTLITDPFRGWNEARSGADTTVPYFGAGHPAIFWLNVRIDPGATIQMSSFGWIGNHYSSLGSPAPKDAQNWWNRLRRWIKKEAVQISRRGPLFEGTREVYAFGGAFYKISNGRERAANP
jgi:hypothetical protein